MFTLRLRGGAGHETSLWDLPQDIRGEASLA